MCRAPRTLSAPTGRKTASHAPLGLRDSPGARFPQGVALGRHIRALQAQQQASRPKLLTLPRRGRLKFRCIESVAPSGGSRKKKANRLGAGRRVPRAEARGLRHGVSLAEPRDKPSGTPQAPGTRRARGHPAKMWVMTRRRSPVSRRVGQPLNPWVLSGPAQFGKSPYDFKGAHPPSAVYACFWPNGPMAPMIDRILRGGCFDSPPRGWGCAGAPAHWDGGPPRGTGDLGNLGNLAPIWQISRRFLRFARFALGCPDRRPQPVGAAGVIETAPSRFPVYSRADVRYSGTRTGRRSAGRGGPLPGRDRWGWREEP